MINFQSNENEYFRSYLVRNLNPVNKDSVNIRNVEREFTKQFSFKFSFHKKDYAKIEKQNNISINVFGYGKSPYHIYDSKQTFEKHDDFLLLSNSKNLHYVLIKGFNKFMTDKTKHYDKKRFCQYYLQCFSSSIVLEFHIKSCPNNQF